MKTESTWTGFLGRLKGFPLSRNFEAWWGSEKGKRYDYLYSDVELERLTERIIFMMSKVDKVLVYFNNHTEGKAALNAMEMKKMIEKAGVLKMVPGTIFGAIFGEG